jgi:hypothetical protein
LGELANNNEARAIKGRSGKLGKRAGKVNVLTWGDLLSGYRRSNLGREDKLRQQESADAIVPARRKLSAGKGRTESEPGVESRWNERRKQNFPGWGSFWVAKQVKPAG